jgi:lysophospholipase L1-like esterase
MIYDKKLAYTTLIIITFGTIIFSTYMLQKSTTENINCYNNRNHLNASYIESRSASADDLNTPPDSILLLGNSLIYDNEWKFEGFISISCAQRGLTLKQFNEANKVYLNHKPTYVVVSFGTVEAFRAGQVNKYDQQGFNRQLELLLQEIKTYTEAKSIIINTIPPIINAFYDGNPVQLKLVSQINNQLRHFAKINHLSFIDLHDEIDIEFGVNFTNDGVHLNSNVYQKWNNLISNKMTFKQHLAPK